MQILPSRTHARYRRNGREKKARASPCTQGQGRLIFFFFWYNLFLFSCDAQVLLQNGISSAPVYDANKKIYVGMFDYGDLMTYILLLLKKMQVP